MSKITIEKKICIEPKYINQNILDNIKNILNDKYLNKCDNQYGYILKIYDNIHIIDNIVSTTSSGVYFYIKFSIKYLKPEIGNTYEGKVCMISNNAILVDFLDGKVKSIISKDKMGKFIYNKDELCFRNGNNTISKNSIVNFKIDMIKYEKNTFNCIGSLKI